MSADTTHDQGAHHPAGSMVDAHQHFFAPSRFSYPWMTGSAATLRRELGPEQLRDAASGIGMGRWVVVQAVQAAGETDYLLELAAQVSEIAGIVGWVDLQSDDVAEDIARLREGPRGHLLVGFRHLVHDEEDALWLERPEVQRGLHAVGEAGLCYDLLVRAREVPAALYVVERHPQVRFVLDHIAKPPIGREDVALWRERLAPLAARPNVSVKFSGMVTEIAGSAWSARDLVPYAGGVMEMFGSERVLFGSDWPVCTLVASYKDVFTAAVDALEGAGADRQDMARILGATASSVYSLHISDD